MNVLVRSITIAALVVCCVQTISPEKQSVRASKKDPQNDLTKVTVIITDTKYVPNTKDKPISSSTFTKNTARFAKKLSFDWSKGPNVVTVAYSDETKPVNRIITQGEVKIKPGLKNPELIISKEGIEITTQDQTIEPVANLIEAAVIVPSGSWTIVSGSAKLTTTIAGSGNTKNPAILQTTTCVGAEPGSKQVPCRLFIYEDKLTKIYTKKEGSTGKITGLPVSDIKKARASQIQGANSPVIITVDDKGMATIESEARYNERVRKQRNPVKPVQQVATSASSVLSTVPSVKIAEPVSTAPSMPSQSRQGKDVPALLQKIANKEKIDMPGADLFNAHLNDAHLENANLKDATLTGAILIGAHLAGADLSQTEKPRPHKGRGRVWHRSLSKANLTGADLTGAKLMNQSFRRATLTDVTFTGADLTGADFEQSSDLTKVKSWQKANLSGVGGFSDKEIEYARLQGALNTPKTSSEREEERKEEEEARLPADERRQRAKQKVDVATFNAAIKAGQKIDMPYAELKGIRLSSGTDLKGANLKDANLNSATLNGVHLENAILNGANLKFAHLEGAHLEGAQLKNADLLRAHLSGAHLNNAILSMDYTYGGNGLYHADLTNADLTNADLTNVNLSGSYLTGAILTGAKLQGAKLENITGLTSEQEQYARAQGAIEISRYKEPTAAQRQRDADETMNYP